MSRLNTFWNSIMSHKLSLSFMLSSIVFVQAAMDKFVQSDLLQSGPNFFQSPI